MLSHPCLVRTVSPYVFRSLVHLHFDVGVPYWLDLPNQHGRPRLTNINTGEYVIYNSPSAAADVLDLCYPDELLKLIYPDTADWRVKLGPKDFVFVKHGEPFGDLGMLALTQKSLALLFTSTKDGVELTYTSVSDADMQAARLLQVGRVWA